MFFVAIGFLTERERKYSVDRDELRHSLRQIRSYAVVGLIAFAGLSAVALIINDIAMAALTGFVFIDYRIAKPIATFVATIWNFISRKKFIDADKTLMLKKN